MLPFPDGPHGNPNIPQLGHGLSVCPSGWASPVCPRRLSQGAHVYQSYFSRPTVGDEHLPYMP